MRADDGTIVEGLERTLLCFQAKGSGWIRIASRGNDGQPGSRQMTRSVKLAFLNGLLTVFPSGCTPESRPMP